MWEMVTQWSVVSPPHGRPGFNFHPMPKTKPLDAVLVSGLGQEGQTCAKLSAEQMVCCGDPMTGAAED